MFRKQRLPLPNNLMHVRIPQLLQTGKKDRLAKQQTPKANHLFFRRLRRFLQNPPGHRLKHKPTKETDCPTEKAFGRHGAIHALSEAPQ